jgi:hypothetical protein
MLPVVLLCLLISVSCGAQVKVTFDKNLSPETVLLKMWEKASFSFVSPAGRPFFRSSLPRPTAEKLTAAVNSEHVDYFEGACIKTDFRDFPVLSPVCYDGVYGDGAMEAIRRELTIEQLELRLKAAAELMAAPNTGYGTDVGKLPVVSSDNYDDEHGAGAMEGNRRELKLEQLELRLKAAAELTAAPNTGYGTDVGKLPVVSSDNYDDEHGAGAMEGIHRESELDLNTQFSPSPKGESRDKATSRNWLRCCGLW